MVGNRKDIEPRKDVVYGTPPVQPMGAAYANPLSYEAQAAVDAIKEHWDALFPQSKASRPSAPAGEERASDSERNAALAKLTAMRDRLPPDDPARADIEALMDSLGSPDVTKEACRSAVQSCRVIADNALNLEGRKMNIERDDIAEEIEHARLEMFKAAKEAEQYMNETQKRMMADADRRVAEAEATGDQALIDAAKIDQARTYKVLGTQLAEQPDPAAQDAGDKLRARAQASFDLMSAARAEQLGANYTQQPQDKITQAGAGLKAVKHDAHVHEPPAAPAAVQSVALNTNSGITMG